MTPKCLTKVILGYTGKILLLCLYLAQGHGTSILHPPTTFTVASPLIPSSSAILTVPNLNLQAPSYIAFDKTAEYLFVLDTKLNTLFKIHIKNQQVIEQREILDPKGLVVSQKNQLLLISQNALIEISDDLRNITPLMECQDMIGPSTEIGFVIDSYDNLYISNPAQHVVYKLLYCKDGSYMPPIIIAGIKNVFGLSHTDSLSQNALITTLNGPYSLAIHQPSGRIYIADMYNNAIRLLTPSRIEAECTAYTISTIDLPLEKKSPSLLSLPQKIFCSTLETLYVQEKNNNKNIIKIFNNRNTETINIKNQKDSPLLFLSSFKNNEELFLLHQTKTALILTSLFELSSKGL